ncbi:MAG TPA: hypothetical protein VLW26_10780 [Steroidobacteraceae bacterium]|nr:hypothetical protein [Steroidobacteraceae bacterium]
MSEPTTPPGSPAPPPAAPSLWERLKHHKVLQWLLAYIGVALAVAHGQELMAAAYDWPHSVGRMVMTLLVLGVPLVLTLAWYHGHKGFTRIGSGELTIISLLALGLAGGFIYLVRASDGGASTGRATPAQAATVTDRSAPDRASIAVLPFRNFSSDPAEEPFADGLSEEILNALARIHDLKVTGRTSSFYFKGRDADLREIGSALHVANILEGSVRRAANQVRITVQLNSAESGYHLWSQTYDRPLTDIFQIQEDIARSVAQALQVTLGVGEIGREPGMTHDAEAYQAFLEGSSLDALQTPEGSAQAEVRFRKALAIDPGFGLAFAGLANSLSQQAILTGKPIPAEVRTLVMKFRELVPSSPIIDVVDAGNALERFDWIGMQESLDHAAARSRSTVTDAERGRLLLSTGRFRDAVEFLQHARAGDPLNYELSELLSIALMCDGQTDAAKAQIESALSLPQREFAQTDLFTIALIMHDRAGVLRWIDGAVQHDYTELKVISQIRPLLDQPAEARAKLHSLEPQAASVVELSQFAGWAAYFNDPDLTLQLIRRLNQFEVGRGQTAPMLLWMGHLRPAYSVPEFKALVRDMHLPQYWRKYKWADRCQPLGADDFQCH